MFKRHKINNKIKTRLQNLLYLRDFEKLFSSSTVIEGTEAVYFLEDHREKIVLCRTEREAIEGLLPLYNMSNDSGKIQFNIGRKHLADFYYRFLPEFKKYGSVKGAKCHLVSLE